MPIEAILASRNENPDAKNFLGDYFFLAAFLATFLAVFLGAAFLPALFFTAFFAAGAAASLVLATFFAALPPKIPSQPEEYFSLVPTRVIVTETPFEN